MRLHHLVATPIYGITMRETIRHSLMLWTGASLCRPYATLMKFWGQYCPMLRSLLASNRTRPSIAAFTIPMHRFIHILLRSSSLSQLFPLAHGSFAWASVMLP